MFFPRWNPRLRRFSPALAVVLIALAGCGGKSVETVKVQGTVTYKGQPVKQGDIAFQPVEIGEGRPRRAAVGKIDPQGTYSLSTFAPGDGVIPGEYKVVIISREKPKSYEITEAEAAALKSYVPLVYGETAKTPLKESIASDAAEPLQLNFNLEGELPN